MQTCICPSATGVVGTLAATLAKEPLQPVLLRDLLHEQRETSSVRSQAHVALDGVPSQQEFDGEEGGIDVDLTKAQWPDKARSRDCVKRAAA